MRAGRVDFFICSGHLLTSYGTVLARTDYAQTCKNAEGVLEQMMRQGVAFGKETLSYAHCAIVAK